MFGEIVNLIKFFKIEISYTDADVYKLIDNAYGVKRNSKLDFIHNCLQKMNEDCSFRDSWEIGVSLSKLPLKSDECSKLIEIGRFLGTTDSESQISMLSMYEEYFKKFCKESENQLNRTGQISVLLGLVLGFAVFIFIY